MSELFLVFVLATVISTVVTFGVRKLMLVWRILDIPNQRSSHTQPTPTLGGIGIVFGVGAAMIVGQNVLHLPPIPFLNALGIGTVVLLLLVYDEIRPMGRGLKSILQLIATVILMGSGIILNKIELPWVGEIALGWGAIPITLIWIFGLQNIYNFMDGIDGLAGTEGVLVGGLAAGFALFFAPPVAALCVAIAGASLGFLFFNFPPAKIFMGDVGAHFLGLSLAAVAIWGENNNFPFWITVVFLGTFLYDATYTLVCRLIRGENITIAHRSHLYQRLQQMTGNPLPVCLVFGILTLMLSMIGFLYSFGFSLLAFVMACFLGTFLIAGTIYIEMKWRTAQHQS